jgi:hypothetical protein
MNITWTLDQKSWLRKCIHHLSENAYEALFDLDIKEMEETSIQAYLHQVKHPQYLGSKSTWPSLYLSSDHFKSSLFHQNIKLEELKQEKEVSFEKIILPAHHLFNFDAIQFDPQQECREWMHLKALDKDLETLSLKLKGEVWMLDVPSEAQTIDPLAQKAQGNVVAFGLGIGYYIFMALKNPNVESITVIEKNPLVIQLFKTYILPQFHAVIPIKIIEADALEWFNEEKLKAFDTIFVDVYQSLDDGLEWMETLLSKYNPTQTCDFWIESSITSILPSLWVLYFDLTLKKKRIHHVDASYRRVLEKMDVYINALDGNFETVDEIKSFIYDPKRHRELLSIKL